MINILYVIQRIIQEKLKIGDNTQLVVNTHAQFMTNLPGMFPDLLKQGFLVFCQEQTQVALRNGEVPGYMYLGYGDQGSFEKPA